MDRNALITLILGNHMSLFIRISKTGRQCFKNMKSEVFNGCRLKNNHLGVNHQKLAEVNSCKAQKQFLINRRGLIQYGFILSG